jgi:hypothetical protein
MSVEVVYEIWSSLAGPDDETFGDTLSTVYTSEPVALAQVSEGGNWPGGVVYRVTRTWEPDSTTPALLHLTGTTRQRIP